MSINRHLIATIAAGVVAATPIAAAVNRFGIITGARAWSRETAAGQVVGGGFLTISNSGAGEDRLIGGSSPIAAEVQLHSMSMEGGVMRMRQVTDGIAIPARGRLVLKPGSFHIMFMGLKRRLRRGERFPVTLRFRHAGRVTVQFAVQPAGSTGPLEASHAGR